MPTRLSSALVLVLALSAPLAATPRWTSLGPYGGDVEHLTVDPVDPRVLYANLGAQGSFKSVDRGASWLPIYAGFASGRVAVDPTRHTTIYQTIAFSLVLKSTDGGAHWAASSILGLQEINELAVDPALPSRIYLAMNGGVWRSLDGGGSWQPSRQPLPPVDTQSLTLMALPRPAGTVFAGTDRGLFKSTDGGDSWQAVGRGLHPGAITALARASKAGTLWAGVKGFGIFLSTDGGTSWRPAATQPQGATDVRALAVAPNGTAWASTASGVYRTTGARWARVGLRPKATVQSLAFGGSTLYAGLLSGLGDDTGRDVGGVFASNDGGATWRQRNRGLAGLVVDVALSPRDPQLLWATAGISGLFRSTVGGFDWDFPPQPPARPDSDPVSRVLFSPVFSADGSTLYVVSAHRLWKTVDEGASWREVGPANPPFFIVNDVVTDPQDPGTLYVPDRLSNLYVSHDAGATWQGLPSPLPCSLISLAVAPSNPATLYAGGSRANSNGSCDPQHAALYRSTDGGMTWTQADAGLDAGPLSFVRSVAVDPSDSRTLYAGIHPDSGVWKSTNGGTTWTRIDLGRGVPVLTVSPVDGSVWAIDGHEVIVSRDAGATWESFGAPQAFLLSKVVPDPRDANRVYVTGWGGVWLLEL